MPTKSHPAGGCALRLLFFIILLAAAWLLPPFLAAKTFGPAAQSGLAAWRYAALLLWHDGLLTEALAPSGSTSERLFAIPPGQTVTEVTERLQSEGFIRSSQALRDYLVYAGLDTRLQSGNFRLSASMNALQIARALQDSTPQEVLFVVLPGWRMEEVAAALPTSGLAFSAAEFLTLAASPPWGAADLPPGASAEGFLAPGEYHFSRQISAADFVAEMLRRREETLSQELREGFRRQGLSVYQAVTLASLVQREAVQSQEQPQIASVFLNRLALGMKLDSDPTVQYALGCPAGRGCWPVPLTWEDLQTLSPFNTYQNPGLPPSPIASPSLEALRAVAFPAQTAFLYFRARCDASGLHAFAETFEQHLANGCP